MPFYTVNPDEPKMFTGLGFLSVHVYQGCCEGEIPEESQKNMRRLTLVLDMLLGLGAILGVYFINKGRESDLPIPLSAAKAITYSGLAECTLSILVGFGLIARDKI